jgi:hypothetical protein
MTFYSLSALDDRIKNADQLITVDVSNVGGEGTLAVLMARGM